MTDTKEISDEERNFLDRWTRVTRCDHIGVRPSTIAGYESRLSRTERELDAMKEALRPFDTLLTQLHNGTGCGDDDYIGGGCTYGMLRRAREALAGKAAPVKEEQ